MTINDLLEVTMKRYYSLFILVGLVLLVAPTRSAIAGSAKVSWQPNSEPDLQGYRIYYGTRSRDYGAPIDVGNVTSYTITGLNEGKTYYFAVTAVDTSGNESGFSAEVSKTIADTHAPTLSITAPTSGSTYDTDQATVDIAGTSSDNVGVTEVTWTNSRGGSGTAIGTTNWSISGIPLSEGDNVIVITATDAAGNQATKTLTVTYTRDTTAPAPPKGVTVE